MEREIRLGQEVDRERRGKAETGPVTRRRWRRLGQEAAAERMRESPEREEERDREERRGKWERNEERDVKSVLGERRRERWVLEER